VSNLVAEILLRLIKPAAAVILGGLIYIVAGWFDAPRTIEVVLLSWLSATAFILLVQEGPL
jgi:hypothetical protein